MSDEIAPEDPVRTRLDRLVPAVDVDAAWAEAGLRMRRDHRRQMVTRAAGALAVVLVVLGLGAVAARASRSGPQPVDVGGPDPTSPPTATATTPTYPDQLTVGCRDEIGNLSTQTVAAGRAGVRISLTDDSEGVVLFEKTPPIAAPGLLLARGPGDGSFHTTNTLELVPGTYDVRCQRLGTSGPSVGTVVGSVEVADPHRYYEQLTYGSVLGAPADLPCSGAEEDQLEVGAGRNRADVIIEHFGQVTIRIGGYPDAQVRPIAISDSSGVIAAGAVLSAQSAVSIVSLRVCPGTPVRTTPLPPIEDMAITSRDDALAWLDDVLQGPGSHLLGLAPGSVVNRRAAKLIKVGETRTLVTSMMDMTAHNGELVWLVAVGYTDPDGVARAALFQFAPSGDTSSLIRQGSNPDAAGIAWPTEFDRLPDHAP